MCFVVFLLIKKTPVVWKYNSVQVILFNEMSHFSCKFFASEQNFMESFTQSKNKKHK